jgi:hypothetical protein
MEMSNKPRESKALTDLPRWVIAWLAVSSPVVVWDALFVLLRPESMPGQKWSMFWPMYEHYLAVDSTYADITNTHVEAICVLSLMEVGLVLIALWHHARSRVVLAHVMVLVVTTLTGAKTLLFFVSEWMGGWHVGQAPWLQRWGLYILPNVLWVVVPGFIAWFVARRIMQALRTPSDLQSA